MGFSALGRSLDPKYADAGIDRDRFFRSQIAELLIGKHLGLGSIAGVNDSELRKMATKHYLITLGCFLLLAVLGFALDVGITAMLLSHS